VRPYLEKKKSQKRAGEVAQGVGPEFKPQYCKKMKYNGKRYHFYIKYAQNNFCSETDSRVYWESARADGSGKPII
jgi:hypothetical protein